MIVVKMSHTEEESLKQCLRLKKALDVLYQLLMELRQRALHEKRDGVNEAGVMMIVLSKRLTGFHALLKAARKEANKIKHRH